MRKETVTVELVDDLDGSPADATVRLGYGNRWYELELSDANSAALDAALEPYLTNARLVTAKSGLVTKSKPRSRKAAPDPRNAAIREWAVAAGMAVPARGRLPETVRAAYEQAQTAAVG